MRTNTQFLLNTRPEGLPSAGDFTVTTGPAPEPKDGEVLVAVRFISMDPAMRGWMKAGKSYIPGVEIGDVMRAGTLSEVLESKSERFQPGDLVVGMAGVQVFAVEHEDSIFKVDPKIAAPATLIGGLGGTGMTAYFGLLDIGKPEAGETVVVSAAAGAVGSVAGQIAKIKGCRTIGIAGGPEKCQYVVDRLGFDACIDYKAEDVGAALKRECPKGMNVYFDNVGGPILDAALSRLARGARIVICGAIAGYNSKDGFYGPKNYMSLLTRRARMEGFVLFDYTKRYPEAGMQLAKWLEEGKLVLDEEVVQGIGTYPEALLRLFSGQKRGKLVLEVTDEDRGQ